MTQAVCKKPVSRPIETIIPETFTGNSGPVKEYFIFGEIGELWIEKASTLSQIPYRFTGKERDAETGMYYYGARYLDPKTSRWISADPAMGEYVPQAPVSDQARKYNKNLPGMGGIFNYVNMHVYHYAGNNPVKLIDPDGKQTIVIYIWNEKAFWNNKLGGAHVAVLFSNPGPTKRGDAGSPILYDPSGSYPNLNARNTEATFDGYEENLVAYINFHFEQGASAITLYIIETTREQEAKMIDIASQLGDGTPSLIFGLRKDCAKNVSNVLKEIGGTKQNTPLGVKIQMEAWVEVLGKAERVIINEPIIVD